MAGAVAAHSLLVDCLEDLLDLQSVGCRLSLAELYAGIELAA